LVGWIRGRSISAWQQQKETIGIVFDPNTGALIYYADGSGLDKSIAVLLLASTNGRAATVVGDDGLLTSGGASQLETWLTRSSLLSYTGPLTFTNIFTKQGGSTSENFHTAADRKGPTISVMQVTGTFGTAIIGGFNPLSWNSLGGYHKTSDLSSAVCIHFQPHDWRTFRSIHS